MKDINCPYCGFEQDINHDDGYGYQEDQTFQQQCENCEKYFVYTTCILFSYDVEKADCLNGEEHLWKKTITVPVEFAKLRCQICGEEKCLDPFEEGKICGKNDISCREPEPYPPYEIGTKEANLWINGWRIGHYGFDRDEEEKKL